MVYKARNLMLLRCCRRIEQGEKGIGSEDYRDHYQGYFVSANLRQLRISLFTSLSTRGSIAYSRQAVFTYLARDDHVERHSPAPAAEWLGIES